MLPDGRSGARAVSPLCHGSDGARAPIVGVYRFWRDMGYVAGGLIAGLLADAIEFGAAIILVAALTAASGLWVALDMPSRAAARRVGRMQGELFF